MGLQRYIIFVLSAIALLLFIVAGYLYYNKANTHNLFTGSIQDVASEIVEACADAPHRQFCYETEIPKLLSNYSVSEVFTVIRAVRAIDTEYAFCHVLAHEIGEYQVAKDPENWLSVLAEGPPDGLCSNGYAHGAIMARFSTATLDEQQMQSALPDFARACLPREGYAPTDLQKAMCFHGLGHVLVHLTNADVPRALAACRTITESTEGSPFRTQCLEGVYMQLFQPLEPEDIALIEQLPEAPKRENITAFCDVHSDNEIEYGICWREAWPVFTEDITSAEGIQTYCNHLPEEAGRPQCYVSAYTINGRLNLGATSTMAAVCNGFTDHQMQGDCFARGANAFLEEDVAFIDEGVMFCSFAQNEGAQDMCYQFLADTATFNFHLNSSPHQTLCSLLPLPYQQRCLGA